MVEFTEKMFLQAYCLRMSAAPFSNAIRYILALTFGSTRRQMSSAVFTLLSLYPSDGYFM
jgi:hypothetical protein